MQAIKRVVFLSFFILSAIIAFAQEPFYQLNNDLKRVGLEELKKIGTAEFESGNYRLDPDFRLGYGDTVNVNLWGKLEASHKLVIGRDGNIVIPLVGRVSVISLTMDDARGALKRELDKKYSNVEFDLNLTDVQDIRISILGNIQSPGIYAVSPFCRIVEAVAKAGGPNDKGSLSDIRLLRDGKEIASFNTCDFIFKADEKDNKTLKHGDTIYVPEVNNLIAVKGDVGYPGIYDSVKNTKLSRVIDEAGGMLPTKFERKVYVLRINPETKITEILNEIIFDQEKGIDEAYDIPVENYDTVVVTTALDYTPYSEKLVKVVVVTGEITIPGKYVIGKNETLSLLIKRAGSFKDTAFTEGAVFTRRTVRQAEENILNELVRAQEMAILEEEAIIAAAILTQDEKEMRQKALEYRRRALDLMASRVLKGRVVINLDEIIKGRSDLNLKDGDKMDVPLVPNWVLITGAVYNPNSVAFEEGRPMDYYLNSVGGPTKFADRDEIYVIKSNGRAESKATGYGRIMQGDIIVVPDKID